MTITHNIKIDLVRPEIVPPVAVVQGDTNTRKVKIELYADGASWDLPDGHDVAIRYRKPDGTSGNYDTLPDGSVAWSSEGNAVSVVLCPQMLTVPGNVPAQVSINVGDSVISTFAFIVSVAADPSKGAVNSENYNNWRKAFLPQTDGAKVGQFLQIAEVDDGGRIIKVIPVENPAGTAINDAAEALQIADAVQQEMVKYSPAGTRSIAEAAMRMANERLVAPETAAVGQYFRVKEVDENGAVTAVEAVDGNYSFNPITYGLPILYLSGDISPIRVSKDNKVTVEYVYGDRSGTCTLKGQGSSSYNTAQALGEKGKFNYTITFDTAFEAVDGWGMQKKYCLKANYIDHTHARNIVSARLWGQIVASRSPINSTLAACPNYGAVDGFPIAIMLNGEFHGLYTWNIPKDKWTFNMGSGTNEAVICANYNTPAVNLRVHAKVDGTDHELEEVTDENDADWVATSLNRVIDMLVNSYGADLDAIAQYLDWESAIDYLILTVIIDGRDMVWKNYIMATWDGTKWVFSAYDMDSTYGLDWNGKALLPPHEGVTFELFRCNRVMELIYRFKTNALKARYKKLRETVLSEYAIGLAFENFGCGIPSVLLAEDAKKWTSIPSTSVNTTDQILRWLHHRLAIADKWIEALPAQETPVAPEDRAGNVVSVSTDASGSIYNGIGYKNGYTINIENGSEAEVAMDGCCISGFIPVTKDNIVKVTTDHWNASPVNSQIIFYDFDLKPMAFYTANGFVGIFNGYTDKTSIQWKEKQSVTYNADGTTTLNIAYGANCTNLAYIRIRGVGNGANLAVIREGEIPDHAPDLEPEVPIDNYIPISIDESGAVYNGTGYKNNVRMTVSDPEVEEDKTGMFTTGFIPLKMTDIMRVTSSTWATSPSNAKVIVYNAQFKAMGFYTANGFVGNFNGYTSGAESNITALKNKEFQSVTVGTDGFTTLNLAYGNECTDVAYMRYDGCGDGAAAVVKLN